MEDTPEINELEIHRQLNEYSKEATGTRDVVDRSQPPPHQ